MNQARQLQIKESDIFDSILELKERLSNIGMEYNTGKIQINGEVYSPKFKVQSKKWAFFDGLDEKERIVLSKNKWRAIDISGIKNREEVDQLILELFK